MIWIFLPKYVTIFKINFTWNLLYWRSKSVNSWFILWLVFHFSCTSTSQFRECSPYCCPVALGQHDHGHTRSIGIGHRTSKRCTDEKDSCWKERKLHQQHYVEEYHGTGNLPVHCNLVSADIRKVVIWIQGRQLRSSLEHPHLQLLCVLPGKSGSRTIVRWCQCSSGTIMSIRNCSCCGSMPFFILHFI